MSKCFNPLSARIFTDFELRLLESRVLHKGAWVATLLGVQDYKKVKFQGRDNSSLAAKGLKWLEVVGTRARNMTVLSRSWNLRGHTLYYGFNIHLKLFRKKFNAFF